MVTVYIINLIYDLGLVNLFSSKQEKLQSVSNQKEDVMKAYGRLVVGFLAVMAVTGAVNASDSIPDARRVDVIDALHERVAQVDSVKAGSERMRVDVIERLGSEGPGYPYTKPMSH